MKIEVIAQLFFYLATGSGILFVTFMSWRADRARRALDARNQARDEEVHAFHMDMLHKAKKKLEDKLKSLEG